MRCVRGIYMDISGFFLPQRRKGRAKVAMRFVIRAEGYLLIHAFNQGILERNIEYRTRNVEHRSLRNGGRGIYSFTHLLIHSFTQRGRARNME